MLQSSKYGFSPYLQGGRTRIKSPIPFVNNRHTGPDSFGTLIACGCAGGIYETDFDRT